MDRPDFLRCETCVWFDPDHVGAESGWGTCTGASGPNFTGVNAACYHWTDTWPRQAFINEHPKEE